MAQIEGTPMDTLLTIHRAAQRLQQYPEYQREGLTMIAKIAKACADAESDRERASLLRELEDYVANFES